MTDRKDDHACGGGEASAEGAGVSDGEVARIVFDALRRANSKAVLSGDPTDRFGVLVDGSFNFRIVAKHIKARLGIKGMPSGPET